MQPEHIDYVVTQLRNGHSEETIAQALRDAGYPPETITNLLVEARQVITRGETAAATTKPKPLYLLISAVVVVMLLAAGAYWYFSSMTSDTPNDATTDTTDTDIIEEVESQLSPQTYTGLESVTFPVPAGWEADKQTWEGVTEIIFVNPTNSTERLSVIRVSEDLLNIASPVALDLAAFKSNQSLASEFTTFDKQSADIIQVSDVPARAFEFFVTQDSRESRIQVVYFARNNLYYQLAYLSDPTQPDNTFRTIIDSLEFNEPLLQEQNYTQNDAFFESEDLEAFTLVTQINFFVEEMSDPENDYPLVCSLAEHPTNGLTELAGYEWNCSASQTGFAIDFQLPQGYYCIDSTGKNTYWGKQSLADTGGRCLEST